MNKELLHHAQEEYLRQYNAELIADKKKPVKLDITIEDLIEAYLSTKSQGDKEE